MSLGRKSICLISLCVCVNSWAAVSTKELTEKGLRQDEIHAFREIEKSKEFQWWGHLSPLEVLIYSSKTDRQRKEYASRYMELNGPKVIAEVKALMAMRQAALEYKKLYFSDEETQFNKVAPLPRLSIFVPINCHDCKAEVLDFVLGSKGLVDVYLAGLDKESSLRDQLIKWAVSAGLPTKGVTLNDENGIYFENTGKPLLKLEVLGR